MALIADFYLETPVLRDALDAVPAMEVAIEQQTLRDTKPFALAFWASGDDFEAFEAALDADPTVGNATAVTEVGAKRLYQAELTEAGDELMTYHAWADLGGVFISSERVGEGWRVRIRFPDRESLREYVDFCERQDLTFDLRSLYAADDPDADPRGLTDRQREALRTATEMGYYDVPRRVELEDVGEVLGVSRQAVSERLRRATEALVRATVYRDGETGDEEESGGDADRGG